MPAKKWSLPLLALAPLVFAAPGAAQADQQQYVVTYVEFLPAFKEVGGELIERLAAFGRAQPGAISFSSNAEIERSNFYVLIELWKDAKSRQTFENKHGTQALLDQIRPLLEAPFDERPGTLVE
jgi:quinol monooxygenase YgiN